MAIEIKHIDEGETSVTISCYRETWRLARVLNAIRRRLPWL